MGTAPAPLPRRRGRPPGTKEAPGSRRQRVILPDEPPAVFNMGPSRRRVPIGDADPARSAWIAKLISDPQGARREALEQRLRYWRARLAQHEARLAAIREQLDAARFPKRDVKPPEPAAAVFELRVEFGATWADVQAARAMVAALEAELGLDAGAHP